MGKTSEVSTHLGGPLGFIGLVLMTGAAGALALVASFGGENETAEPDGPASMHDTAGTGDGDELVNVRTIPPSEPETEVRLAISREVEPDTDRPVAEEENVSVVPAPVLTLPAPPTGQPDQTARLPRQEEVVIREPVRAIRAPIRKADFVVRFKGLPEIEEYLELYRKDPEAGRAAFEAWARDKPELSGLTLTGVTYSDEAILTYVGAKDQIEPTASVRAIARRIQSVDGVRYADPDYTAQPGKGD